MTERTVAEHASLHGRTETLALKSNLQAKVINIGHPSLDVKPNLTDFQQTIDELGLNQLAGGLTVIYDNRSYLTIWLQAFQVLKKDHQDVETLAMAIARTFGLLGTKVSGENTVYMNTQNIAFWEVIRVKSLDTITKHELAHLTQPESPPSQAYKNIIAALADWAGGATAIIKSLSFGARSSHTEIDNFIHLASLSGIVAVVLILKRWLYLNAENEQDSRRKEKSLQHLRLTPRAQTLTERTVRRVAKVVKKPRPTTPSP